MLTSEDRKALLELLYGYEHTGLEHCPLCKLHLTSDRTCPTCPWRLFGYNSYGGVPACAEFYYRKGKIDISDVRRDPLAFPGLAKMRANLIREWLMINIFDKEIECIKNGSLTVDDIRSNVAAILLDRGFITLAEAAQSATTEEEILEVLNGMDA